MKLYFHLTIFFFIQLFSVKAIELNSGNQAQLAPIDLSGHCVVDNSITKIATNLFYNNNNLKSITLNDGLEEIGSNAFRNSQLTSVVFPASLKIIGKYAFEEVTTLTSITLKEGLEEIGDYAFAGTKLISVVFPASLKIIGEYAFYYVTTLTSITLKEGLEEIGDGAFRDTRITSVVFPASLKIIEPSAFEDVTTLTSITVKEGLEEIEDYAFYNTRLTSVNFPASLKIIGSSAFEEVTTLTSITLKEGLDEIGANAFSGTKLTSVVFPASIKKIGLLALSSCSKLTDVTLLANNLTSLGNSMIKDSLVRKVTIPSSYVSFAGSSSFSTFDGFKCDLNSKCECVAGYGCEQSQSGTLVTASQCDPGTYKEVADKYACTGCPAGKYMKPYIVGSTSSSDCITCPVGTNTDINGSYVCLSSSTSSSLPPPSSSSSSSSSSSKSEDEDLVARKIAIAAVVIGSFSLIINILNFSYYLYDKLPKKHMEQKIPNDEKEIEVVL